MEPINFEHANQQLSGGNGGSLPVNKFEHDGHTYQLSIWRAGIVERLAVLFTGRVQLVVRAEKHPIVAVSAGFGVREYDTRPTSGAADLAAPSNPRDSAETPNR